MTTTSRLRRSLAAAVTTVVLAASGTAAAQAERGPAERELGPKQRATFPVPRTAAGTAGAQGPGFGTYRWPVHGEVLRPFDESNGPFGAGHRGIDIAAPFGAAIRAPADGTVSFAGTVAGSLFISIDHPGGIRTSYSWVSVISVKKGAALKAGAIIGGTGQGHPGSERPHLHFSTRLDGTYIDPMLLLGGGNLDDVIHLAESVG